jgi:hypothetical protein
MDLNLIRTSIEEAISVSVQGIQFPGIAEAELKSASLSFEQLQTVAAQLADHGNAQTRVSAEIELFLRGSSPITSIRGKRESSNGSQEPEQLKLFMPIAQ